MMMIQIMPIWTEMIMINMEKVPMGPMVPMDHIDVVVVGHRPGGAHLFGWDPVGGINAAVTRLSCGNIGSEGSEIIFGQLILNDG